MGRRRIEEQPAPPEVTPEITPEVPTVEPEVAPSRRGRGKAAKLGVAPVEGTPAKKQIIGYIDKVYAVLVRESYQNPVTGAVYERFHLADGSTQVLSEEEIKVHFKAV